MTTLNRASGYATTKSLDANGRLGTLTNAASGSSNAVNLAYTASGQIKSRTQSNAAYAVAGPGTTGTTTYGINGHNRITNVNGGTAFTYDGRGNLTGDGGSATYSYNVNNLLTSTTQAGVTSTLVYDAENRLHSITRSGVTTKFLYDGANLIAEYSGSNTLLRSYVHGQCIDHPLVWYEGATTSPKYYLYSDERGSMTAVTSSIGVVNTVYGYNEYGVPSTLSGSLSSRFRYTGQAWLPEVGLYYYKARMYAPSLGRFLQPDPIGYGDGMNLYAYVGNDPINRTDPTGLFGEGDQQVGDVIITHKRPEKPECPDGARCYSSLPVEPGMFTSIGWQPLPSYDARKTDDGAVVIRGKRKKRHQK